MSTPELPAETVDDVIITSELESRPAKTPDFAAENRILESLASAMLESPQDIFQMLVDGARDLCHAGSAGVSIWNECSQPDVFRWQATTGEYTGHLGETLPRQFSPCGTVLDRNRAILMANPARFFPYIDRLSSPVHEVLLVPFYDGARPIGTVWVVMHAENQKFDAEDERIVTNLTKFASMAVRTLNRLQATEKAEQELRDIRARIESTLIAGEIGTWVYDIENDLVRADRNLARMFGVTESDAAGGPLERYVKAIHADDRSRVEELIQRAVTSESAFEAEYRLVGSDGKLRWVVARGTIERNAAGKLIQLPGVVVDITDRKRAEDELRASEDRRRLALDAAELGTWNLDPTTSALTCDDRFRRIFSGTTADLSYEQAFGLIHPSDRQKVRDGVAAAIRPVDPIPYEAEYRVVRPDDSVRWVYAKGCGGFTGEGFERRLTSLDGTVVDITSRKQMEDELRRIAAELSEADHRKNEFLAMLAHELRNPLAPIRNALSVIELSAYEGDVVRTTTELMNRQISHMVRLVDDLLDVSRITRGKIELRIEEVDLIPIVGQAVESSRPMIEANGHQFWLQIPQKSILVRADAVRLVQVLGNLLNNACKYSEPNGQIWLAVSVRGNDAIISVKDAGVGIAESMLPKIFDLFTQIDASLERSQGGLGIGLSLVRSLVDLHGGTVKAQSAGMGHGSEFIVQLPIAAIADGKVEAAAASAIVDVHSLKILIVDDNRDSAITLAMVLKFMRNETRTAHDGAEAVTVAGEFRPDVVLMDIGLPKLNGHEAAMKIRAESWGQDMTLVALTGWGQDEDRRKSIKAGFDGHLVKPVDHVELKNLLAELVSRRRSIKETSPRTS